MTLIPKTPFGSATIPLSCGQKVRSAEGVNMKAPLINELKTRRQTLGWSIKDLGERCGIDEKLLLGWEHGVGLPRLDAVETWATALGLTLALSAEAQAVQRGVRVDWDKRVISVDGTPVRLTPMEWKALERLAKVPGELVTHEALFRHLYGDDEPYRIQSTAIRVLITKLRRLLPLRIEARWGRGYVVSGLESSPPGAPRGGESVTAPARRTGELPTARSGHEALVLVPTAAARDALPVLHDRAELSHPKIQRAASPTPRPSACRTEELGVIERFLAERGVTRCPDVATIQLSPLPTLVWDKIKRKWVRPPQPVGREAG